MIALLFNAPFPELRLVLLFGLFPGALLLRLVHQARSHIACVALAGFGNGVWSGPYSWSNDFKHAMDYMSEKQKEKIEKKKNKAEAKGNEYDLDIMMIAHPLVQSGGNLVVVGEMYYPEYQTYTDSKGVTTTTFVGYHYSQSIIVSFTNDFTKNWDQSFAMGFLGGFRAIPTITVRSENNKVTCAFVVGSTLHYEVIGDAGTIDKNTVTTFAIKDQGETVRYTAGTDISYWFGDSYLACGNVRKKDKSGDKETVYYLTIVELNKK